MNAVPRFRMECYILSECWSVIYPGRLIGWMDFLVFITTNNFLSTTKFEVILCWDDLKSEFSSLSLEVSVLSFEDLHKVFHLWNRKGVPSGIIRLHLRRTQHDMIIHELSRRISRRCEVCKLLFMINASS